MGAAVPQRYTGPAQTASILTRAVWYTSDSVLVTEASEMLSLADAVDNDDEYDDVDDGEERVNGGNKATGGNRSTSGCI